MAKTHGPDPPNRHSSRPDRRTVNKPVGASFPRGERCPGPAHGSLISGILSASMIVYPVGLQLDNRSVGLTPAWQPARDD